MIFAVVKWALSEILHIQKRKKLTMHIQAYLRILSTEGTIRALHSETGVAHASIEETKARRGEAGDGVWWYWQTQQVPIDTDNPDDGLRALLLAHRPIFPIIKRHQGPETDIYLEVVTQYEKGEEPSGMYLSAETILLLSEIGGAFDNDVYAEN
jgi:hypothetical protein